MTTADRLRREGEIEGRIKGKREVLLRLLRQRFGDLPAGAAARITKASATELDSWLRRFVSASSLEDVLGTKSRRSA